MIDCYTNGLNKRITEVANDKVTNDQPARQSCWAHANCHCHSTTHACIHTNPLSFVNATFFTHQPNNVAGKKGTDSCQAIGSSHAKISRMNRTYCYKNIMKSDTLYIYIHHFINNVVYMTTTTTLFVPFLKIIYKINNRMRRNW